MPLPACLARAGQTIHPDDWPGLKARFLDHLLGKTEVFSHQHRVLDRNGKERWIQSRGKVIEHDATGSHRASSVPKPTSPNARPRS